GGLNSTPATDGTRVSVVPRRTEAADVVLDRAGSPPNSAARRSSSASTATWAEAAWSTTSIGLHSPATTAGGYAATKASFSPGGASRIGGAPSPASFSSVCSCFSLAGSASPYEGTTP